MLRGGSKLLHSLLDNHTQLLSFPRTFQYFGFWNKIKHQALNHQFIADEFVTMHPRFFSGNEWYRYNRYDKADRLGKNQDETFTVDINLFKSSFCELMSKTSSDRKNIFLNLYYAFHLATHKKLPEKKVIIYHVHTHDFYDDIALCVEDFFHQTQLVLTLRHPLQGVRSCFNWTIMHNSFSAGQMYHYQTNIYEMGYVLNTKFPNNKLKIIPLEQVKANPQQFMQKLALAFGINWEESLVESTILGKLWSGNTLKPYTGVDRKNPPFLPRNFLEKKDWKILSYFFYDRLSLYQYLPLEIKHTKLNEILYFFGIFLPTTIEAESFILSFNPFFYYSLLKMTHQELVDPRLTHFDYARKKQIFKKTLFYKLGVYFFRLRQANPLLFFYYYPKRIFFMLKFLSQYRPKLEPALLLDE